MSNPFDPVLQDMRTKLAQRLLALPRKIGAVVLAHTNDAFRKQGFTDAALEPWTPSKAAEKGNRATLVKTGRLRRSIRIISATPDQVIIGTDVPYAQVHNEGGTVNHAARQATLNYTTNKKGKLKMTKVNTIAQQRRVTTIRNVMIAAHSRKMPQRKFLGNSETQTKEITNLISWEIQKALSRS